MVSFREWMLNSRSPLIRVVELNRAKKKGVGHNTVRHGVFPGESVHDFWPWYVPEMAQSYWQQR